MIQEGGVKVKLKEADDDTKRIKRRSEEGIQDAVTLQV